MTDMLQVGSAWLEAKRHAYLARAVAYVRGRLEVGLQATVGRTLFEAADAYGVVERSESRDFLVRAADLVLDAETVLPERGDRIRETQDGKVYVYEVMAPGQEPCWRWSDSYRQTLRIHTRQVAVEA